VHHQPEFHVLEPFELFQDQRIGFLFGRLRGFSAPNDRRAHKKESDDQKTKGFVASHESAFPFFKMLLILARFGHFRQEILTADSISPLD
jgi:hypothetical protein